MDTKSFMKIISIATSFVCLLMANVSQAQSVGAAPARASSSAPAAENNLAQAAAPEAATEGQKSRNRTANENALAAADLEMLAELTRANTAEIQMGKLAQTRTKNPDVMAFAQKMIEDHTNIATELGLLAEEKGHQLAGRRKRCTARFDEKNVSAQW